MFFFSHFWQIQVPSFFIVQWYVIFHHLPNVFILFIFFIFLFHYKYNDLFFFFVTLFLGRGAGLRIFHESKSPWTCENGCFNPPWPKLSTFIFETLPFAKVKNAILWTTTLWGFTNPTMLTLDVLKNEVMGVLSTMSSIHKIFSTFTQFHFEKTNDSFF